MRRAGFLGIAAIAVGLAGAWTSAASAGDMLQPYQLVRSLQLVQDRIADGDQAAMPMQSKLLELIDARFRSATAADFGEPKNFRALLVYGMSGGNPVTVEAASARLALDAVQKSIAQGVVDYLNGRPAEAIKTLEPVDPMAAPADIGAFLALVKGSLLASEQPAQALGLLDEARLLSPGTLVEEAALRRSVAIAVQQGDAARFALASTQYVQRFLHSPYAGQFADSFVSGVIALNMAISHDKVADITSMMDAEREKVIYLRIARRAAIDGLSDLSAFASARAEQGGSGKDDRDDPRALLYVSLSTVTSGSVEAVLAKLKGIDRSRLSEGDRSLLDAARAVAGELVAPVAPVAAPAAAAASAPSKPNAAPGGSSGQPDAALVSANADLPKVEGEVAERPATGEAAATTASAAEATPPSGPAGASAETALPAEPVATANAEPASTTLAADPTEATVVEARRQLDLVDQMLGAAPQ